MDLQIAWAKVKKNPGLMVGIFFTGNG